MSPRELEWAKARGQKPLRKQGPMSDRGSTPASAAEEQSRTIQSRERAESFDADQTATTTGAAGRPDPPAGAERPRQAASQKRLPSRRSWGLNVQMRELSLRGREGPAVGAQRGGGRTALQLRLRKPWKASPPVPISNNRTRAQDARPARKEVFYRKMHYGQAPSRMVSYHFKNATATLGSESQVAAYVF